MNEPPDLRRLAEHLRLLGNPNRLELLYALRTPRSVSEIELHPEKVPQGENPERAISHQAVREHLGKLRQAGVIVLERQERAGKIVDEYVLNHQKLFAIVEEMRLLGELRAEATEPPARTLSAERDPSPAAPAGPRLILVRGQREGHVFPLRRELLAVDRGWTIGRKRGLPVSLDYDPFVSAENAEVLATSAGFQLMDLRTSRNGTYINFKRLATGATAALRNGDIVTVGRTNLVFRVD